MHRDACRAVHRISAFRTKGGVDFSFGDALAAIDGELERSCRPEPGIQPREQRCNTGLVCPYTSASAQTNEPLGMCTHQIGEQYDRSDGHPEGPCASGLACVGAPNDSVKTCRVLVGADGATCGQGLTPSAPALECTTVRSRRRARPRWAKRNEACGEGVAACFAGDVCTSQSRACEAANALRVLEAFCSADLARVTAAPAVLRRTR